LDDHEDSDDEAYWQRTLRTHGWVISVYAVPIMLIQSQVYGKLVTNKVGNTADFLYENEISGNV
jgi:hypothetical protein